MVHTRLIVYPDMAHPNLLFVDDNFDNLLLLCDIFEGKGYNIQVAINGKQALELAEATSPDLILLDIQMPDMDGYEVCKTLKDDDATKDIPVIFISGMGDIEDKIKAFEYGGVDYVTKPFQITEVFVRVQTQLALQRSKKQIEAANKELAEARDQLEQKVKSRTIDLEKTNAELRTSKEHLKGLSAYLQQVREEEKAHIAQEVHDELGATLTALNMDIHWLRNRVSKEDPMLREKITSMAGLVSVAAEASNRIVTSLRPSILDDLGLLAAIEWQADEFAKRYGIVCSVTSNIEYLGLSKQRSIAVFRIFQEALTNIAKHAHARRTEVMLMRQDEKFFLQVADDGVGLPDGKAERENSHGVKGMKERAGFLEGELHIESGPGEGVRIEMWIPLGATEGE